MYKLIKQDGGKISLINENECKNISNLKTKSRKEFLNSCIFFYDMEIREINIVDINDDYIRYNKKYGETYKLDDKYELSKLNTKPIYQEYKEEIEDIIEDNIDYHFKFKELEIPYIFLKLDYKMVFQIFILLCNDDDEKEMTLLKNLFSIENEYNEFITMSSNFNIFNVALLMGKYFEIVELLLKDIITIDDLMTIFNNKEGLKNIYDTFIYISALNKIPNSLDLNLNTSCGRGNCPRTILTLENELGPIVFKPPTRTRQSSEIFKSDEYDILFNQLNFIKNIFKKITNFKDFPLIFLMSIINFRLKKRYLNGTWGFSYKNLYEIIRKNINKKIENEDEYNIKKLYNNSYPILFEYKTILYKEYKFSNCIENTILQFLKIILYNYDKNIYNLDLIENEKLKILFEKLNNDLTIEDNNSFMEEFLDIIYTVDKLDYVNNNYELTTNIDNIKKIFFYLFKTDDFDIIIKKNNSNYNISVNNNEITVYTNISRTIILDEKHAYVEEDNNKIKIINYINIINLDQYKYFYYKNILIYLICIDIKDGIDNLIMNKIITYFPPLECTFDINIDEIINDKCSYNTYRSINKINLFIEKYKLKLYELPYDILQDVISKFISYNNILIDLFNIHNNINCKLLILKHCSNCIELKRIIETQLNDSTIENYIIKYISNYKDTTEQFEIIENYQIEYEVFMFIINNITEFNFNFKLFKKKHWEYMFNNIKVSIEYIKKSIKEGWDDKIVKIYNNSVSDINKNEYFDILLLNKNVFNIFFKKYISFDISGEKFTLLIDYIRSNNLNIDILENLIIYLNYKNNNNYLKRIINLFNIHNIKSIDSIELKKLLIIKELDLKYTIPLIFDSSTEFEFESEYFKDDVLKKFIIKNINYNNYWLQINKQIKFDDLLEDGLKYNKSVYLQNILLRLLFFNFNKYTNSNELLIFAIDNIDSDDIWENIDRVKFINIFSKKLDLIEYGLKNSKSDLLKEKLVGRIILKMNEDEFIKFITIAVQYIISYDTLKFLFEKYTKYKNYINIFFKHSICNKFKDYYLNLFKNENFDYNYIKILSYAVKYIDSDEAWKNFFNNNINIDKILSNNELIKLILNHAISDKLIELILEKITNKEITNKEITDQEKTDQELLELGFNKIKSRIILKKLIKDKIYKSISIDNKINPILYNFKMSLTSIEVSGGYFKYLKYKHKYLKLKLNHVL